MDVQSVPTRRETIVRDSLAFLTLTLIAAALSAVTWLLFQSFTAHRADLARSWSDRGKTALAQGRPAEAIAALRSALSYAPDDHDDELMLAQALAAAGHTEEARIYYLGLWDAQPGDGFINLQLARLARTSKQPREAIDSYRAAIFGNWGGQGVERRRDVRLELAGYLIEQHDLEAARAELLIAGSNNPGDAAFAVTLGDKLALAEDSTDALICYRKAIALQPHNAPALERAGRIEFQLGDYEEARKLLEEAIRDRPNATGDTELKHLIDDSGRLIALNLSRDLPARVRVEHLLDASAIAQKRLQSCSEPATPGALQAITAQWAPWMTRAGRNSILHDPDAQDDVAQLIGATETATAQVCGQPTGDDALLLKLARAKE
jgi:tetratricopeptide (TPR) repeat protein